MFKVRFIFVFLFLLPLARIDLLATNPELLDENSNKQKEGGNYHSIEILPDEVLLIIFASLNQKEVPIVTRTSKRWNQIMDNNHLWKSYAERALGAFIKMKGGSSEEEHYNALINSYINMQEDPSKERDYRALVKSYCIPSFTDLGFLNGGKCSSVHGVSFDGSVIVGCAHDGNLNQRRAFRWTAEKGMESLGTLDGWTHSSAKGVSFDGSVIVGVLDDGTLDFNSVAFRWTEKKGMESLGAIKGWACSLAEATNFDGSVIVGNLHNTRRDESKMGAFRWTAANGIELLDIPNEKLWYEVKHISFDGSTIVGCAHTGPVRTTEDRQKAFRWTAEKGMEFLRTIDKAKEGEEACTNFDFVMTADGGQSQKKAFRWSAKEGIESVGVINKEKESEALCTNSDGLIFAGLAEDARGLAAAFRWTPEEDLKFLDISGSSEDWVQFVNLNTSIAQCINSNGSVIAGVIGVYAFNPDLKAFRWTSEKGMESVEKLLKNQGVLPSHLTLTRVNAITPNGAVLVGEGRDNRVPITDIEDEMPMTWRAVVPRPNLF